MLHEENENRKRLLSLYKGQKSITHDGKRIRLYANIASTADLKQVLDNDAEGIGNFKTEFLYLNREDYPTEDELFMIYKAVAEHMRGKKTIIRTFDISPVPNRSMTIGSSATFGTGYSRYTSGEKRRSILGK